MIAVPGRVSSVHVVYRLTAKFTVTELVWNRYKGQMSSVPPARSTRHGAFARIFMNPELLRELRVGFDFVDLRRVPLRVGRHQQVPLIAVEQTNRGHWMRRKMIAQIVLGLFDVVEVAIPA